MWICPQFWSMTLPFSSFSFSALCKTPFNWATYLSLTFRNLLSAWSFSTYRCGLLLLISYFLIHPDSAIFSWKPGHTAFQFYFKQCLNSLLHEQWTSFKWTMFIFLFLLSAISSMLAWVFMLCRESSIWKQNTNSRNIGVYVEVVYWGYCNSRGS